ncbi:MAG: Hint domain-containing protein [Candidatus Micrarchaeales archaeon]|nr:Hint domain-containing protein [Candidatus Micrarchaeales archaeon]
MNARGMLLAALLIALTAATAFGVVYSVVNNISFLNSVKNVNCTGQCTATIIPGDRLSNFLLLHLNGKTDSVSGLSYMVWPLVSMKGYPVNLSIGDFIGYTCDGSEYQLLSINLTGDSATFEHIQTRTGPCPVCLSGNTTISTPEGQVNVKDLRAGMSVWTIGSNGDRIAATIIETSKVRVPSDHIVMHIVLVDGRQIYASPGHPTADGRMIGELTAGSQLDGSTVILAQPVQYNENYTYDILPSGSTGFYWANGILIGSTLKNSTN